MSAAAVMTTGGGLVVGPTGVGWCVVYVTPASFVVGLWWNVLVMSSGQVVVVVLL